MAYIGTELRAANGDGLCNRVVGITWDADAPTELPVGTAWLPVVAANLGKVSQLPVAAALVAAAAAAAAAAWRDLSAVAMALAAAAAAAAASGLIAMLTVSVGKPAA